METKIETPAPAAQGGTSYTVVILSPQDILANASINSRDEVAYDAVGPFGSPIGKFYDGNVVHNTGLGITTALNDRGQVAGSANVPETGALHAYRWSLSTGLVHLDTLGPPPGESATRDINNRGQVAGISVIESGAGHAVLWNPDGSILDLGTNGGSRSDAWAINDAGEVAGYFQNASGNVEAFIWTEDDGMQGIGSLGGGSSMAIDINSAGEITGGSTDASGAGKPFFWSRRGGMIGIGLGGRASDINDRGMVVGAETFSGQDLAFAWTRETGVTYLGTLGGASSVAVRVNNRGQVVGSAQTAQGARAFVWSQSEGMVDLNTRIVDPPFELVLTFARAISGSGAIVASSTAGAVLLVPCPGRSCIVPARER